MNTKLKYIATLIIAGIFSLPSCNEDDGPQPFLLNFTNTNVGIDSDNNSVDVGLTFSRAASTDGTINISIDPANLSYGTSNDFYTEPLASDNIITLPYKASDESVGFTILAGSTLNIDQDETISVELASPTGNFIIGDNTKVTITFSENFIAPSGTLELDAGGESFSKQAYVDFSKLKITTVDKLSWDLGFYTAIDEFYVTLNAGAKVMARTLDKNDLNNVSESDTIGFGSSMIVPNYTDPSASAWIDSQDGDLSKTAISAISSVDSNNKVIIIKRDGDNRHWKKIRVLRNGDDYKIEHADIGATTFSTVEITKDQALNFVHLDIDNGKVSVAPTKNRWDIMYGSYSGRLPAGLGSYLAVSYNDYIILNRYLVSAAMIMTDDIDYVDFTHSDVANQEFLTTQDAIGSSWRDVFAGEVYDNRFFVFKDTDNNVYKLKFTRLSSTSGERGYPELIFEQVKPL